MNSFKFLISAASVVLSTFTLAATDVWDGTADTDWSGDGTPASPYLITSPQELAGLAKRTNAKETFEGKYFRLAADIYLSDPTAPADQRPLWTPIGDKSLQNVEGEDGEEPENPGDFYANYKWFKGNFDGAGHTIFNLWYSGSTDYDDWNDPFGSGQLDFTAWNKALFGLIDGGSITNLTIADANVMGSALVAGLAIEAHNATFENITVTGEILSPDFDAGGSAAGIVAEAYNSRFVNCNANVRVKGKSGTGTLIGRLYGGSSVENCHGAGEVYGSNRFGGLIGTASYEETAPEGPSPVITNSICSAEVYVLNGRKQGNDGAGFIGYNTGHISRCGATGNVKVTHGVGAGFCIDNFGHIESCYATGDVYNDEYGVTLAAFVDNNGYDLGYSEYIKGTILNCFGTGALYAPEPPTDIIAMPTYIAGFAVANYMKAGAEMTNCYYNSTANPKLFGEYGPVTGSYPASEQYLKSQQFVDDLNHMAAIMGTHLWKFVEGGYPLPTDKLATTADIIPFFAGGDGTEADPWLISNKKQLENLAFAANRNWNFFNQYFKQTSDIALNDPIDTWGDVPPTQWTPIAQYTSAETGKTASHRFCGVYDGDGHIVDNMYIDMPEYILSGLFGVLAKGAEIRNLGVTNVWMASNSSIAPIAGATRLHNEYDQFEGDVTISHCYTSGEINKGYSAGLLAESNYGGTTYINSCYSTVDGFCTFICNTSLETAIVNGSWFAGKAYSTSPVSYENIVNSYFNPEGIEYSGRLNPAWKVSTEYMQSKEFVNRLNYAAAAKGYTGGWGWNDGAYPSFGGQKPSLTVTLSDGVQPDVEFEAFEGTTLSMPNAPEREGYQLMGWYTNPTFTTPFEFDITKLTSDISIYGKWIEIIAPDYTIFNNKFAKSFTITTPAQLYALANIVRGVAPDMDRNDFEGKTINLGNDIILNDVADFDFWGNGVTPLEFPGIGSGNSGYEFNGTFDGKGYSIIGHYSNDAQPLFDLIGKNGSVKNLRLQHAYVALPNVASALFAKQLYGVISQCGADGKIVDMDKNSLHYDYSAGLVWEILNGATVSECFADVEMDRNGNMAGLVGTNRGNISNSYAVGSAVNPSYGGYGGVVGINSGKVENCFAAVALEFGEKPESSLSCGGAYAYSDTSATPIATYYDKNLVETAFDLLNTSWNTSLTAEAFAKGTGLSTPEMKMMKSFPQFDFNNVWGRRNDLNNGYPYLRWTNPGLENDPDAPIVSAIDSIYADSVVDIWTLQGTHIFSGKYSEANLPAGIYIVRPENAAPMKVVCQ